MSLSQRAVRATITLGDIELDCYQMPDGDYWFSQNQMKEQLQILPGDSTGKKYFKPLLEASPLRVDRTKIEGNNAIAKVVHIDLFKEIVAKYAELGNKSCSALVAACFAEALERRADIAFGKVRTEEERNERIKNRQCHREDFHPKFTTWLKLDGVEGNGYAIEVNNFKRLLGLPIESVNSYDSKQLRKLDVAYIKYDTLRTAGMKHEQVINSIA
jgi:hypothetical protein